MTSPIFADGDIIVAVDKRDKDLIRPNHNGAVGHVAVCANAELSTRNA
jgi:hypothetical protein